MCIHAIKVYYNPLSVFFRAWNSRKNPRFARAFSTISRALITIIPQNVTLIPYYVWNWWNIKWDYVQSCEMMGFEHTSFWIENYSYIHSENMHIKKMETRTPNLMRVGMINSCFFELALSVHRHLARLLQKSYHNRAFSLIMTKVHDKISDSLCKFLR